MKTIRETLASFIPARAGRVKRWMKPFLAVAIGFAACAAVAQPANDNFASAFTLTGATGSTNGDNTSAILESCEPLVVTCDDDGSQGITNSVWFVWTAPTTGTVEFDTIGSSFDTVLSIWQTPAGLCDPGLTNIISDDSTGFTQFGDVNDTSYALFQVTAGQKYYISVDSWDDGNYTGSGGYGPYLLNWSYTNTPVVSVPTVPTGAFSFSSASYVVSDSDSSSPGSSTVNAPAVNGVKGARITVIRPEPAYGRVLVDYTVTPNTYTNIYTTNYYGTNLYVTFKDTNTPPIVFATNYLSTNIYSINQYFSYNGCAYISANTTNGSTNGLIFSLGGVYSFTNPPVTGPYVFDPSMLPFVTNYVTTGSANGGGFSGAFTTNIFGYLQLGRPARGTNYVDGLNFTNGIVYTNYVVYFTNTFITNYIGTNINQSYTSLGFNGPFFSTNYLLTNSVIGYVYSSNSIYTNGAASTSVLVTGTNWLTGNSYAITSIYNASNHQSIASSGPLSPYPTNMPALGSYTIGISDTTDSSGNETIIITNVYHQVATATQVVNAGGGISNVTGTLTFDNLQMSQDLIVPVSVVPGPDFPYVRYISSYAGITLSNARLDPLEATNTLIPPTVDPFLGTAGIIALGSQYAPDGAGVFNFERSTFQVDKNVPGGKAVIYVNRVGGNPLNSVSVNYIVDPANGLDGGDSPPCTFSGGYSPTNTFVLEAGSDYAMPDSDFTIVSSPPLPALSWAPNDYNAKTITIPILNNGQVEFNHEFQVQLYAPATGTRLGLVNEANVTVLFDDTIVLGGASPGQQPAGAMDRSWNKDNSYDSDPPNLLYPGTTPGFGGTVYAVAEQPDGNSIVAGSFVSFDSTPYNRIVRVMTNGYQDPAFQGNFAPYYNSGANEYIASVVLQPDGKILIAGNFTAFNGYNRHHIARLNSDGSLDTTFNPGNGTDGRIWSMALQTNGQIVVGGEFSIYNTNNANKVARLNADGSLDTTFNVNVGGGPNDIVKAVAVDATGRVIIGGAFDHVSSSSCGGVARLNVDGSLDNTFTPGIGTFNADTFVTDPIETVAIQADGKILIGGSFSYIDLVSYSGLARLSTDGSLDLTFHPGNGTYNSLTGDSDTVNTILLQPDGKILIGGNFEFYNQTRRIGLARIFTDGSLDTSFMDTAYNQYAGVPNRYFNGDAIATDSTYLANNTRNSVLALALESGGNIIVGGSFTRVGGGFTRDDIRPRSNVARVIGGITPGPGNVEFVKSSYTVNNSDGTLYVSLLRTNGNLGSASVLFSTNTAGPGPGVATGNDFSLLPNYTNPLWPVTWFLDKTASWTYDIGEYGPNFNMQTRPSTLADVYISVSNPGNITGNLSAGFGLSLPSDAGFNLGGEIIPVGVALGVQDSAPLTIIDSNIKAGVISFSSPVYSVIEGNNNVATITVTRTNGSAGSVTFWYSTSNGTATNGVDYTGSTNQITIAAGVTNATFTVPTRSKYTSIQPDKTVLLSIFTPGGGASLGLTNAVLTLINPNYTPGHVSLSLTNYSVNENGGSASIVVNRLGGSATSLRVTLQTVNGTAYSGTNYVGYTNQFFWAVGDATTRTATIPVIDDGVVTPNLIASLQLTNSQVNGTNNALPLSFGGTNSTLTIVNVDSAGTIQFSSPTYSVKKYAGYALVPITRTGGSIGAVSVNFTTLDDTAVQSVNYTYVTNTLTFTNGELSKIITVPILPTGATNGLKDLFLQLNTNGLTTLAGLGNNTNSTLYIIDSDSINEPPGSADTTLSSFAGFNNNVYSIVLQSNNQMVVGGDFTMADGVTRNRIARLNSDGSLDANFSFPASTYGANNSVRSIAVQADGRILIGGFFTNVNSVARGHVARLNYDGTLDNIFNPGSGADNAVYAVAETFVSGVSQVLIGGSFASVSGTPINGIARLNSDGTVDGTFNTGGSGANATVYALVVQSDGKILIGGDFTHYNGIANLNHIARLNPDGTADTNFNVAVSGPNDSVRSIAVQLDGRILIGGVFTNVNGVVRNHIARLNADGTLDSTFVPGVGTSDSVFSIALQSDNRIVLGGVFTSASGVTRNRVTRLNQDGSIDPSINFGSGANDFVATVAIQEDTIIDYPTNVPDEKIIIGGGFTQYGGAEHDHIARIYGGSISGSGTFQFSAANYQVDEINSGVVITVQRFGGTTNAPTGDVFVTANTSDGSARAGVNYSNTMATLDFPVGETFKSFVVPILDDGVITTNLTVNLTISSPTPPAQLGSPTALLTIINDDSGICFSNSQYFVSKSDVSGAGAISLIRLGGTNSTISATFIATNGTAVPGTDYTPVNQTVVFYPGVTNVTTYVSITNNGITEGLRTVNLTLTNPVNTVLVAPSNAVLNIQDTATLPGNLSFAATNFTASSGDGYAYLTVSRANGTYGLVSASYYTIQGTALPGVNYVATTNSVTFQDGDSTPKTAVIPLINNPNAQASVSLTVSLFNPTGNATLTTPTNTTLVINNTNAVFSFVQATNTVAENSGAATLVVQRFNNTNIVSTVNYATVNGTALAGINYSNTTGTLTFGVGQTFGSINVPLINRSNIMDLVFGVNLSSPTQARLIAPSNTVVILQAASAGISFTTNSATVLKSAGSLLVTVTCSNPRVEPVIYNSNSVPLQVNFTTVDGTAKAGVNYQPTSGTIVFTNGIGTNTFIVPIFNNQVVSGSLGFSIILTNVTAPGQITPYGTQSVVIAESNAGLSFSQADYYFFKNAGLATITVNRTGFTNDTVSVDYMATNGSALAGQNFYPTNGTLIFTNGVTAQTFNVQLIANTLVQPNLYALLELGNPTNGIIVNPGVAKLTILENGGSYVVPSGAMLVTNYTSHLNDGIIYSNDTVKVLFGFRDSAGLNVTNLIAYLLATNGVTSPSPASQTYGPLTVYGHSVSMPFTFTAHGTNALTISPTFQLYDNTKYIGPATFVFTVGTWNTTFANTNVITINDNAAASPYPSIINVTNVGNTLVKATVTITNLSHASLADVDALVVAPATNTLIMAHVGGSGIHANHLTLTFDDGATNNVPTSGVPTSGSYKPTQVYPVKNFP